MFWETIGDGPQQGPPENDLIQTIITNYCMDLEELFAYFIPVEK